MKKLLRWSSIGTLLSISCAGAQTEKQAPPSASSPAEAKPAGKATSGAADGVSNPELAQLLEEHWEDTLKRDPFSATRLGDHRFDTEVGDRSLKSRFEEQKVTAEFLARARALPKEQLDARDQITAALFASMLGADLDSVSCNYAEWNISAQNNPVAEWNELAELHQLKVPADGANLLARYSKAGAAIDVEVENLRRGLVDGATANAESTRRVVSMVEKQLAESVETWPMYLPATARHEGWSAEEDAAFSRDLAKVLETGVRPALQRYLAFVKTELTPRARSDERPGLASLSFGKKCYSAQVARFTTLEPAPTPEELHELGKQELARINGEMVALGQRLFGLKDLPKILAKLRTDRALYFTSDVEVEEKAKHALDAARAKIKDYFGILPKADCVVVRIPDYEAPFSTVAYYRQPVPDGSKPGEYFINVLKPETRTRYEAEALAFHESIPGHHLQIAIAQELPALPAFRKHLGMTAFVEGWGLYTEQLADEMGLYSSDLDRMGKLSYESWRASRLVVDTGLHAMGFSREAAKKYMLEHTALAPNNIDNEVDRYIVWPGQALAYKTGQLEISRLRARAEKELGPKFDIKAYHDVVLGRGAVTLPVLRAQVEEWIRARAAQ